MSKKDKPAGTFQAPPPGAPHQVSTPLSGDDRAAMLQKAKQNERELKPFNPSGGANSAPIVHATGTGTTPPPPAAPATQGPEAGGDTVDQEPLAEAPLPVAEGGVGEGAGAEGGDDTLTAVAQHFNTPPNPKFVIPDHGVEGVRRPAESNTDSPSRGVPHHIDDPGKVITGGWGDGGGEYFALDGGELAATALVLFADLKAQMDRDLRFGIATVYPQVRVRVVVQVDGVDPGVPVNEQKFDLGASRILTLEAVIQDDQDTPADAIRDHAGLLKPRKQRQNGVSFDVPAS